jgi:hypothetical protein
MRQPFAHEAVVAMDAAEDERAPGAAITVELCGHWEHEPPCPLAPHATVAERDGDEVRLRILFAVEAEREAEVHARIDGALAAGRLECPDGTVARWQLHRSGPSPLRPSEADHGRRLAAA